MPRFHFNVYDGRDTIDKDGSELLDDREARREAIRLSGAILEETGDKLQLGEEWCMEVTDDAGSLLFRLEFTIVEGPAKGRSRSVGIGS